MSEKVQVWRDESIENIYEPFDADPTGGFNGPDGPMGNPNCPNNKIEGNLFFGNLLSNFDYNEIHMECSYGGGIEGWWQRNRLYRNRVKSFFNNGVFIEGSINSKTELQDCQYGRYGRIECGTPKVTRHLEQYSAKDLVQHIDDEVRVAHDLKGSDIIDGIYQTENFAIRKHETLGNLTGVRIRKDTPVLNANGEFYKFLHENEWIWFTWGLATRGNSFKSHISTIATSENVDSELVFAPPLQGGTYGIMYVYTGEDLTQESFDWRSLNISTMPRDDM